MKTYYRFQACAGEFRIVREPSGRWQAMYQDEKLGSYENPFLAADDLSAGHTRFWPSIGDTTDMGIPENISDWEEERLPG